MGSPISWPMSSVQTNFSLLMRCALLNQLRPTYLRWFHHHTRFFNHVAAIRIAPVTHQDQAVGDVLPPPW
jgi:hypothetical protein